MSRPQLQPCVVPQTAAVDAHAPPSCPASAPPAQLRLDMDLRFPTGPCRRSKGRYVARTALAAVAPALHAGHAVQQSKRVASSQAAHSTLSANQPLVISESCTMGSAWHTREEKSRKEWVLYVSAVIALLLIAGIAAAIVVAKKGSGASRSSGSVAAVAAAPAAARSPPPPAGKVAEQSTSASKPPPPPSASQAANPPPPSPSQPAKPPLSPPTSWPPARPPPPPPKPASPPPVVVVRPPPPPPTTYDSSYTALGTTNNVPPAPGRWTWLAGWLAGCAAAPQHDRRQPVSTNLPSLPSRPPPGRFRPCGCKLLLRGDLRAAHRQELAMQRCAATQTCRAQGRAPALPLELRAVLLRTPCPPRHLPLQMA